MIAQWPPQPTPQTLHRKDSQDKRELTPKADEVFNDVLFTWHCHCLLPHPPPHTPPKLHPSHASFSPTTTSRSAFTSLHPSATTKRQMFWPDTSSISKTCGEGCERVSGLETGKGRDVYVGHNSVHAALYSATCTTSPPRPRSRKIKKKKKKKTSPQSMQVVGMDSIECWGR